MDHKITGRILSPAAFLILISASLSAAAQQTAYGDLAARAGGLSLPVQAMAAPVPGLPSRVPPPNVDTGNPRAIASLDEGQLAAATPEQRLAMLRTLIKWSHPSQNNQDSYDSDQKSYEDAILGILRSSPDAASFDRLYYNVDESALLNSVSWSGDITDLRKKFLAATVPGDWKGLDNYIDVVDGTTSAGRNHIEFLVDGANVMPKAVAAIKGAKSSINVEVYQLEGDDIGWAFTKLLSEKAREGVKVRLVIDRYGSDLKNVQEVGKMLAYLNQNGGEAIPNKASLTGRRDHRKVMVIDGRIGFTGGMNVGRDYQYNWHDQQSLIEGPAVAKLQEAFLANWAAAGGKAPSSYAGLFPPLSEPADGVPARVMTHWGQKDRDLKAVFLRAFSTAQRSILIADPYFADPDVVDTLCAAARRGVKVTIVTPKENDVPVVQHATRGYYPKLLKAGVQIYEYRGRMAHEKVAVIDTYWSTFGSSNLDARSLWYNDELNVAATDPNLASYIEAALFDKDIENSDHITSYSPGIQDHAADIFHGLLTPETTQAGALAQ